MEKFIIVVDGEISTRYKYNLWEVFEYEDGTVSEDRRMVAEDDPDEFLRKVRALITKDIK